MRYIISFLLTSTAALAEVPSVVTDIPPVQSLAAAVMEGVGEPQMLLGKGASPHSYELKPSQALAISEADLLVWVGPQLTPWLDKALDIRLETATLLTLIDVEATYRQDFGASGEHDHEAEDHDHDGAEAEAGHDEGHDHSHTGLDPHAWLDPANGKVWARAIAAELSRLDPENAAAYAANAEKAVAAIDAADAEAAALLAPVKDKPYVAFHDAYGYFSGHYGLTSAGTVALGDAAMPGAQRLTELRAKIQAGGVVCIFPEAQHDPALVAQMAEGTGIRVGAVLDPSGSAGETGPAAYPALLTNLARAMADCLSGS
ncbi:zinc ABC transporter substrate-binding protein [Rhodobacter sp. Har01]|uniref:zinc ABC transporter substrate-binding protein n=1 Tax=Rhodobacter sp. Har01 TaxID=2883999 RepID=UPI001D08EABE|nr:zinc ABC transporter substrate-binding protein [Rhodobacter sp. Har01]MCB6179876.1 zinc ABC transporter substrate-binding protein [Rhodobacter sp. Har01]